MPRAKKFRFYLDENFPFPVGWYLRSLGHAVLYACRYEIGATDYRQIQRCIKEKAIFLTIDRDFLIDHDLKKWAKEGYGIILFCATDSKPETIRVIVDKVIKQIFFIRL